MSGRADGRSDVRAVRPVRRYPTRAIGCADERRMNGRADGRSECPRCADERDERMSG